MPKLTIGIASHSDFDGTYFTIQSLRMHHPEVMKYAELVVVDQTPDKTGDGIRNVLGSAKGQVAGVSYVPMADPIGTSCSRNRIFEVAEGDVVLVLDSHVLLPSGGVKSLLSYFDAHPNTKDIVSGPIMMDSLVQIATHFNDVWRAEMWGVWGAAFACGCDPYKGVRFSCVDLGGALQCIRLGMGYVPISICGNCSKPLPDVPFAAHEEILRKHGFVALLGTNKPFEIPGMGLGMFACRKDAWPGFNQHARGFGGEELYIHTKIRRNGGKAICLPSAPWGHRFIRPAGSPYALRRYDKVRNYVLEFQELNMDLEPIEKHFVASGLLESKAWDHLLKDPIGNTEDPSCDTCNKARAEAVLYATVDEAFDALHKTTRDLNEHMPVLKEYAERCSHVTEFTNRKESTVAFLAAEPKSLISYQRERSAIYETLAKLVPVDLKTAAKDSPAVQSLAPTEMLFLDTQHTYSRLSEELRKFAPQVSRYIIVHDTQLYGDHGEDGGRGLFDAMTDFMRENPQWSVLYHTKQQYGLTILGVRPEDKPPLPSTLEMAGNFVSAMASYVWNGLGTVPKETFETRLKICSFCDQRNVNNCSACGCYLQEKASLPTSFCPLGKWDKTS